jgi:hypothetical protein
VSKGGISILSLMILAAVVTSFLYELRVYARSNDGFIPLVPPSSIHGTTSSQKSNSTSYTSSQSTITHQRSNEGTLTIKQVILGTDKLLRNSKFKITPNPFSLKGSLTVYDKSGVVVLRMLSSRHIL